MKCGLPGCRKRAKIRGWCDEHREQIDSGEPVYYVARPTPRPKRSVKKCSAATCSRAAQIKGLCRAHYKRTRTGRTALAVPIGKKTVTVGCKARGCDRPHRAKGYCGIHYRRINLYGSVKSPHPKRIPNRKCSVRNCEDRHSAHGLCVKHYRKANRAAVRSRNSNRRAQVKLSDPFERSCSVWARKDMEGERCWYCGKLEPVMHVDHAIPLSKGGTENWTNLVRACGPCNLRKNSKTEQEFFALLEAERTNSTT